MLALSSYLLYYSCVVVFVLGNSFVTLKCVANRAKYSFCFIGIVLLIVLSSCFVLLECVSVGKSSFLWH